MIESLDALGGAALPAFWLPVAAWTILIGLLALFLRAFADVHPLLKYRLAQGGLLVLPLGVLLAVAVALAPADGAPVVVTVLPAITLGAAPVPPDHLPIELQAVPAALSLWTAAGAATLLAMLAALVGTARLLADAVALRRLRRRRLAADSVAAQEELDELRQSLGVRQKVRLHVAPGDVVPMTAGALRPVIILPASLENGERRLALAHELVHVRQRDVLGQWLERVVAALFAIHPGVHWLRRRCALLREMSCDAALVTEAQADRRSYADLLFSYADERGRLLAPGMADRLPHVHQRIKAMAASSLPRLAPSGVTTALLIAGIVLAGSLAIAAPRLGEERVQTAMEIELGGTTASDTIFVVVEQMPVPVGGLEGIQQRVRYPELARRAGIEGTVFVQFVVNRDGSLSDLRCTRDPGAGTCEAAIEAIRETQFEPGRQRGEPARVRFSLPVRYRLDPTEVPPRVDETLAVQHLAVHVRNARVVGGYLVVDGVVRLTEITDRRIVPVEETVAGVGVRLMAGPGPPTTGEMSQLGETTTDSQGEFELRVPFDEEWHYVLINAHDGERRMIGMSRHLLVDDIRR